MYKVEIVESTHELSARDRLKLKDTTNAVKLDSALTGDEPIIITPIDYAVLEISSDKVDAPYNNYVVCDESGQKFITGSKSFWEAFLNIWDEMVEETGSYQIEIYKVDSKNYAGKKFITCSIL